MASEPPARPAQTDPDEASSQGATRPRGDGVVPVPTDDPSQRVPVALGERSLTHLFQRTDRFVMAIEIETSRGLALEEPASRTARLADSLCDLEAVDLLCLTDNPGGHPSIRPETMGERLLSKGQEVVVNFSCKDYNRNAIESRLWALGSMGLHNLLALTGDYPAGGYAGNAGPVFDIDSVGVLELVSRLNAGYPPPDRTIGARTPTKRTGFYPGAAVNPFKRREDEYLPQLQKLLLKVQTGARWAATQVGYDARKLDELQRFLRMKGIDLPILGSVFILSAPAARLFNRWGIPGVAASDELVTAAERAAASDDKGREFFLELAAKQIAVLKGLGYRGVYLSGRPTLTKIRRILEIGASFGPDDWKEFAREVQFPLPGEFYLFQRDEGTGLSSDRLNPDYIASYSKTAQLRRRATLPLSYRLGRFAHDHAFDPTSLGFKAGRGIYALLEKAPAAARSWAHGAEQAAKVPLYGCRDCGDCSLPDIAYLCPESQCVKNQRNGPCGGTKDGQCEVLDKECIWGRAYQRLKAYGEEERMLERPVIFRNGALKGTSAWANTFLGRDHHSASSTGNGAQR